MTKFNTKQQQEGRKQRARGYNIDITKPEERKNNVAIGKSIIRAGKKRAMAKKMKATLNVRTYSQGKVTNKKHKGYTEDGATFKSWAKSYGKQNN